MKKIECNLIVCGPAVGKTYLAEQDSRFVDLDEMKAIYKYGMEDFSRYEKEHGKLNRGKIVRNDSFEFIIQKIKEIMENGKIGLLSYNPKILKYIVDHRIPYCLVYAPKNDRSEYIKRMEKRGNTEEFINEMTNLDSWNKFYRENKKDRNSIYQVELQRGQYLSDIKNYFINGKEEKMEFIQIMDEKGNFTGQIMDREEAHNKKSIT